MADLSDAIKDNAEGLKRASGDSGSAEQHSLKEMIEADRYLQAKEADALAHRGLRFTRFYCPQTGS